MKFKSISRKLFFGAILAGLLPMTNAFALATFPTTGSCAMLVTVPVPLGSTIPANNQSYNIVAVLDLAANTIKFFNTRVNYTTSGVTVDLTNSLGGEGTFTVTSLATPAPTEARQLNISITSPSSSTMKANAIAVNDGKTILIQGATEPFSGVCNF